MNELVKVDNDIVYSGFTLHAIGITPVGSPTFEQWQDCWSFVGRADGAIRFWRGDLIRFAENAYGEMYTQFINNTGKDYQTLANDKWVASKIDLSRRRENLTFAHHEEVVDLDQNEQDELWDIAERSSIKSKDFRQVVKSYKLKKAQALLPPIDTKNFSEQVIHGDCLVELPKIADKSIDMIYVDPPYNIGKDTWDAFNNYDFEVFTIEWLKQCMRVIKDKAHLFINFDSDKVAWLETLIAREFGHYPASRLIWHYRNAGGKSGGKVKFSKTYEPILHYNFGDKELNFPGVWDDKRFDVWTIAIPQSNFAEGHDHPTQKPLELLERLVLFGSKEGDMVLDPMAGSGTTGVVCQMHNRQFCLIEREEEYLKQIYERLSKEPKKNG